MGNTLHNYLKFLYNSEAVHNVSYILSCRREPYSEPKEQCEGEEGFDEAPHVLEGSGLAPVDGMGREIRGMRTRG
jgi:hypothetical protein